MRHLWRPVPNPSRIVQGRSRSPISDECISTRVQYAQVLIAVLCLLMGSLSFGMCVLSLRMWGSLRNENEYLNAFIQSHLPNVLFLNKYSFINQVWSGPKERVSSDSSIVGYGRVVHRKMMEVGRVVPLTMLEYGPAFAMALVTTNLCFRD